MEITLPLDHTQIGFTLENFYPIKKHFDKHSNKVKSIKGNSYRFLDFTPLSPDLYQSSYTDYVASVFKNEPFTSGWTYTADALEQVRIEDIPLARNDSIKYVMVFTDGASSDRYLLPNETFLLQSVVDKVYGFGIGAGADPEELSMIATDDREGHGWKVMSDFSNYQSFIRNFINRFGGCKTTKVQPYRKMIFLAFSLLSHCLWLINFELQLIIKLRRYH